MPLRFQLAVKRLPQLMIELFNLQESIIMVESKEKEVTKWSVRRD